MRDPASVDVDGAMPSSETKAPVHFAGLVLDLDACMLSRETGETVPLTRGEFTMLRFFASHPRRVLSRDLLLDATAGRRFEPFDRSVDVMVGRLRRKIEPDPKAPRLIVTVPGGYQFAALLRAHPNRSKTFLIVLSGRESDIRGGATRQSGERMKMPASSDIFLFGQFRL